MSETRTEAAREPRDLLARLVRPARGSTAVAVAAVVGGQPVFAECGHTRRDGEPVGARTRFEIGSVSKTLTGLLLAEMAARGDVRYDDPVERFLPPARGRTHGGPITLLSLATHTSGLPRNPPGLQLRAVPRWFSNPWAGFTERHLVAARRRSRPKSGGRTRYSTFGIGLLGHALGVAAGMPYPELLAQRVLIPLGMSDTDCGERAGPDLAVGYWHGRPRPPAALGGMPAAGAVRSTGRDLLRYVDALARPDSGEHPLPAALRTALAEAVLPREAVTPAGDGLGLVWNIRERPRHELYFHSGGTRGFTAFAGFSPQTGTALVALANTSPSPRAPFIQQAYLLLRELAAAEAGR